MSYKSFMFWLWVNRLAFAELQPQKRKCRFTVDYFSVTPVYRAAGTFCVRPRENCKFVCSLHSNLHSNILYSFACWLLPNTLYTCRKSNEISREMMREHQIFVRLLTRAVRTKPAKQPNALDSRRMWEMKSGFLFPDRQASLQTAATFFTVSVRIPTTRLNFLTAKQHFQSV